LLAIVKAADTVDDLLGDFFSFLGRKRSNHFLKGSSNFTAGLPRFFGATGPGPGNFVFCDRDFLKASRREDASKLTFLGEPENVRGIRVRRRHFHVLEEWPEHYGE
jgi:hypothetical protein